MAFINTIAPAEATGDTRDMYARQQSSYGYVPNYAKVFGHRPEVMVRWGRLLAEIRRPMDDRLFELATFAAAYELRNTACSLAHGQQLAKFINEESVQALARGEFSDDISEAEKAVVRFRGAGRPLRRRLLAIQSEHTFQRSDQLGLPGRSSPHAALGDVLVPPQDLSPEQPFGR